MSSWQPNIDLLQQIVSLFRDSSSAGSNNQKHQEIQRRLCVLHEIPDYTNYLVYILTSLRGEHDTIRAMAGLYLKNNVATYYDRFHPEVRHFIKESCLKNLADSQPLIRNTMSTLVTTIVARGGLEDWPQLLPVLMQLIDSTDYETCEGSLNALRKICEDSADQMDSDLLGKPINYVIPKCVSLMGSSHERIRVHSLACINQLIRVRSAESLMNHLPSFMEHLYQRAYDTSAEVRRYVCQSFVALMEIKPNDLMPHLGPIVEYMLHCSQDGDANVAIEACEFWVAFAEQPTSYDTIHPILPRLIPILLKNMIYTEEEILLIRDACEDGSIPDSTEDMKPRFHKVKLHGSSSNQAVDTNSPQSRLDRNAIITTTALQPAEHLATMEESSFSPMNQQEARLGRGDTHEEEEEDEYEEEDDDEADYSEWTLRKSAAAGLDMMANIFSEEILPPLLNLMTQLLYSPQWEQRESVILALGAVAEGCAESVESSFPDMMPYLLKSINDPHPLVRSISCWTIGRYAYSYCQDPSRNKVLFESILEQVLHHVLDNNKRVQNAACSALSSIEEACGVSLAPYLSSILPTLVMALHKFQHRNFLTLLDAITTLAESVQGELAHAEYVELLMTPLMQRWNSLMDHDRDLFPLLECFSSLASGFGAFFRPFAAPVLERCTRLIVSTLQAYRSPQVNLASHQDLPDREFAAVALDLISGIVEGLGSSVEDLIEPIHQNIAWIIVECLKDEDIELRQSALAVLGDLTIACFKHIQPYLGQLFPELLTNLDPKYTSVCNNAVWSLGELSIKCGDDLKPFIPLLVERLLSIFLSLKHTPRILLENAAIAIGRLGKVSPDSVASHLPLFLENWCTIMKNIRDNAEKESACRGMCDMVRANPAGVVKDFGLFCEVIVSWRNPPSNLRQNFSEILNGFKSSFGPQWPSYYANFPAPLKNNLARLYGL